MSDDQAVEEILEEVRDEFTAAGWDENLPTKSHLNENIITAARCASWYSGGTDGTARQYLLEVAAGAIALIALLDAEQEEEDDDEA